LAAEVIQFRVSTEASWLSVGSRSEGELQPAGHVYSTELARVLIDPAASSLGPGIYTGVVYFENLTNERGTTARTVTLTVLGPTIVSPAPGSRLSNSTVRFSWTANGVGATAWYLYVGTAPGARDIHASFGNRSWTTVYGVPIYGGTVWVRLWWYMSGNGWHYKDFSYQTVSRICTWCR